MRRSSYSGLRTIRGFLHANPVSFVDELTSISLPTDLSTTFTLSRIFIRVGDRSPAMACFVGPEFSASGERHEGSIVYVNRSRIWLGSRGGPRGSFPIGDNIKRRFHFVP